MKPRSSAVFALSVALAAPAAAAEERTWFGVGIGAQTIPGATLGDAREIVSGLGLTTADREPRWLVPRVTVGFDLDREATTGIDVTATWFADAVEAVSSTPVRYRVRRDVVPVTALFRYATPGRRMRTVLGVGPVVAFSRFEESGWLGDTTSIGPALGGQARLGSRIDVGENARFFYGLYVQWMHLPRNNPLLRDGGGAFMGGLDLGFDFGL